MMNKRTLIKIKGLMLLMTIAVSATAQAQTKINFEVNFPEPQTHFAEVTMYIDGAKNDHVDVKMPVWAPGSYLVREFAKNVEDFSATAGGKEARVEKTKKNTWRVYNAKGNNLVIKYKVYCFEISVRTSFIDASHAFLSSTGIFMYVDGMLDQPAIVKVNPNKAWSKVSTGLEPVSGKPFTYKAANFDILYDSPIEVGNQDIFNFNASGVDHEVAMYGGGNYDKERLKKDMAKIVEEATAIYGENPNKHYVFIVHNYNAGGGGLEHLNSTVLGASRFAYSTEKGYKGFLSLVAHEYSHLWNVKRLRPIALGPFDYDNENYTTNLWVAEGFTAYYDNLLVRRAGFYTPEKYVDVIAGDIATVVNQPGARVQPLSESSFDAWIKSYRPNENSKNSTISYYDKGSVIAMMIDLEIIKATKGTKMLDDVMRAMYNEYYKKQKRGYTDAEFKAMLEKVSGVDFTDFYAKYINGTAEVDYNKYLAYAGISLDDDNADANLPFLGATTSSKEGKWIVSAVLRGSAAWNDGINVNDEIIAIDGYRVNAESEKAIANKKAGDNITVTIARDGMLQNLKVKLTANPVRKFKINAVANPTAEQITVRTKWLKL